MNGFILDCSVALTWLFVDEATVPTDALLRRLEQEPAYVPRLWYLEVGNALVQAVKRKRISSEQMMAQRAIIAGLNVEERNIEQVDILDAVCALAQQEGLTVYDACYLFLALRKNLPLATMDKALRKAAIKNGLKVLPS